jgi:hypothetical protein
VNVGAATVSGVFGVEGQLISTSESASRGMMRRYLDIGSSSGRTFRHATKGIATTGLLLKTTSSVPSGSPGCQLEPLLLS